MESKTEPFLDRVLDRGSFWLDSLPQADAVEVLQGPSRCDVAVIGGGFTGLSTAYHARQLLPGADVRVIEAGLCGGGSSGRSGGFSSTLFGLTKGWTDFRFGRQRAVAAHQYMKDAVAYVEKLIGEHGIGCDFERNGTALVATTRQQARRVEAQLRIAEEWGIEVERWDAKRLADEFKTARPFHLGMIDRSSGLLNPARFARGLLHLAKGAGAVVYERSPVDSVEESPTGVSIHTQEGCLHAERVVFATNAYSALYRPLEAKQAAVLNHIVVTEPLSDGLLESVGWHSRIGVEDARNMLHYFRLTADNRILLGGGDITPVFGGNGSRGSPAIYSRLERHLIETFPQLRGVSLTHRWGGRVSITLDLAPVIGTLGRRALFALGLMGHGVSMAPYNGLCLAELLAGRKSERTEAFFVGRRALPWPPRAIRFPLLHAVRGIMRLEDRLRWDRQANAARTE